MADTLGSSKDSEVYTSLPNVFACFLHYRNWNKFGKMFDELIDWLYSVLSCISNISSILLWRLLINSDHFEILKFTSLLFIEIQWNDLLRARVVILDTGHNLTPHPVKYKSLFKYLFSYILSHTEYFLKIFRLKILIFIWMSLLLNLPGAPAQPVENCCQTGA